MRNDRGQFTRKRSEDETDEELDTINEVKEEEEDLPRVTQVRNDCEILVRYILIALGILFLIFLFLPIVKKKIGYFANRIELAHSCILNDFPMECQNSCEPCNFNQCWEACDCGDCYFCILYNKEYDLYNIFI